MSRIGPQAADYEEVVVPLLEHEDRDSRIAAINCLGSICPGRFYPEIARLAVFDEDDHPDNYYESDSVHFVAVRVLAKSESLEAVPYMLAIYLDGDPWRSGEAIRQTAYSPPDLQQALIPGLIQLLGHSTIGYQSLSNHIHYPQPVREQAIDVLGRIGELALPYLDEIERRQSLEEDPKIRIRYAEAILHIGGHDDKQIGLLRTALLDSKQPNLQSHSCRACAEMPWLAEILMEELLALIPSEDPWVRESATEAICATDLNTPEIIAALNQRAVDYGEETWTCWAAMQALAERGELGEPMEMVLQALVAQGNYDLDVNETNPILELTLDNGVILQQLEAKFVEAEFERRAAIIAMLEWYSADAPLLQRLLELELDDGQRKDLEFHLHYAQIPNVHEPLTDWRVPTAP